MTRLDAELARIREILRDQLQGMSVTEIAAALAAALILKHRANISRLLAGTEKKLGSRTERVAR